MCSSLQQQMPIQGSGQGALAGNCLCSPSGCVDGCLSQRHSLMESRISLQRHSSVASSHQPLLSRLQSWYTSQYRCSMSWPVESGITSSMVVGSAPRSCLGNGSHWPQQMTWSCLLWPVAVACKNICWHRNSQWSLLHAHCLCS